MSTPRLSLLSRAVSGHQVDLGRSATRSHPDPLRLSCLSLSRRVRFTNRFTVLVLQLRVLDLLAGVTARVPDRRVILSASVCVLVLSVRRSS
jgi:hypothetical protein